MDQQIKDGIIDLLPDQVKTMTWDELVNLSNVISSASGNWELNSNGQIKGISNSTFGGTLKNAADASTTQVIPHSLGRIPNEVELTAIIGFFGGSGGGGGVDTYIAMTLYNGITQSSMSIVGPRGAPVTDATFTLDGSGLGSGNSQIGTLSFDGKNIYIAWVKTGSPVGTYRILWKAK